MGAPATGGSLCKAMVAMDIGDYIKCYYSAPFQKYGVFSFRKGTEVEISTILNQYTADGDQRLASPIYNATNGYFYFIKADTDIFIADRVVNKCIAYNDIFQNKDYVLTGFDVDYKIDILSYDEYSKYLTNGLLNGKLTAPSQSIWNSQNYPLSRSDIGYYYEQNVVLELTSTQDASFNIKTILNFDLTTLDTTNNYREATPNHPSFWAYSPIYVSKAIPLYTHWVGNGGSCIYNPYGFRPVIRIFDRFNTIMQSNNKIYGYK